MQFRFESVGDVLIGPYTLKSRQFMSLKWPQKLIYRKKDTLPICFVSAFSEKYTICDTAAAPKRFDPSLPPIEDPYISSAPLSNVSQIRVYCIPRTNFCRGITIQYRGGGKLALGQCRLGVDPFTEYEWPVRLCFANTIFDQSGVGKLEGVKVECLKDHDHVDGRADWTCCEMTGVLYCWFNQDEMRMRYTKTSRGDVL